MGHNVILRSFTSVLSLDQVADFGRINYGCHSLPAERLRNGIR